jgi:hypothetical protein
MMTEHFDPEEFFRREDEAAKEERKQPRRASPTGTTGPR